MKILQRQSLMLKRKFVKILNSTESLVVCSYPTRDLDRLLSFYNAAKELGRDLVIDLKQAYILKLFQRSDNWRTIYPKPDDRKIKIYIPKKGWGLIDKDYQCHQSHDIILTPEGLNVLKFLYTEETLDQ
jgi:hypothetical protein